MMIKKSLWVLLCILLALPASLAAAPAAVPGAVPAVTSANLLQNPGFEAPYVKQCCHTDLNLYHPNTPIDEVQVAAGWAGWWRHDDGAGTYRRPEWREAACGPVCANRVRSGSNAQKYFTFFGIHHAGMLQTVGGIAPGQRLRFSVYMHAWSHFADEVYSEGQGSMGLRVGIDPFGGTNPFSPNIIWSPVKEAYDVFAEFSVEAVARAGAVTVFTHSLPQWPLKHNDVYIDDASLVVVGATINPPPGGGAAPTPRPTATQVTGFVYTVQPGDHYYKIARFFGVSVASILAANPTATPNILRVGARLIIPGVSGPPAGGGITGPGPAPTNPPPAPTLSPLEQPGAFTYVVVRGDNLYRLSIRFNTTIARIKQLNGLTGDIIQLGQTLIIAPP